MEKKSFHVSDACIFSGIDPENVDKMLACLGARRKALPKGTFLFRAGDAPENMSLVVAGAVDLVREDFWGHRTILRRIEPGFVVGAARAVLGNRRWEEGAVSVSNDTEVLSIDANRVLQTCSNACQFHHRLIHNIVSVMAENVANMYEKVLYVEQKSLREKILAYLSAQSAKAGNDQFEIPFTRQELADYLNAERSAVSNEIGKLQKEGLLRSERKRFILIRTVQS